MKFKRYLPSLFFSLGLIVMAVGISIAGQQQRQNTQAIKQATGQAAPSTTKPKPSDLDNYKVAPDSPRYISIPSINVRAIVRSLSLTKTNQIDSPANVYDAGWFSQSSKPGQAGAMVVDGHVSSWSTKGVFYDLKSLRPGQVIVIEKGDGTKVTYTVVKTQTYEANNVDMAAVLSPVNTTKPGLNLITCAGSVIKGTNEFDKRIVVFTELN